MVGLLCSPLRVCFTVRIDVDIDNPAGNREGLVFPLADIQGADSKKCFSGCFIMVPMDLRYVMSDPNVELYKASVCSPNCLKVTVPSWPHGPLHCRDSIAGNVDECATNAMDNARHAYFADIEKRQWKHFYFLFPDDHELSAKDICDDPGEDNDELEVEIVPMSSDHLTEKGATDLKHWAAWKVARVDISPMKKGKIESSKKSKAAVLAEKMHSTSDATPMSGVKEEAT
jgi:hypothetical protein